MVEWVLGILVLIAFLVLLRALGISLWRTTDSTSEEERRIPPRAYRNRFKR